MDYTLRETLPDPATFLRLRRLAGLTPYSEAAARRGLPNSRYGVTVYARDRDLAVGIGRIVGDGGSVFHVCDMAVHPDHQGRGIGSRIMDALMEYIDREAPPGAYVNLMADVDGFYERWGFERTAPSSRGMSRWTRPG